MAPTILDQIALLQRESRFLRNLALGILLYSIAAVYLLDIPFLVPNGFLFAILIYLSARDINKTVSALQPEQWGDPKQVLETVAQVREESAWRLHTRLSLLFAFYFVDLLCSLMIGNILCIAFTLALCGLYEWGLWRFDQRAGIIARKEEVV